MLKIVYITHYDNMYGANNALYKLIKTIVNNNASIDPDDRIVPVVIVPAKGTLTNALEAMGVKCIINSITQWQAPYVMPFSFAIKRLKRKKQFLDEVATLYEQLKSENVDIIHSNSSVIGTGAFLAEMLNVKHIWHIREFAKEHFGMEYFFGKSRVKSLYEKADVLVAISEAVKDNYREKYPSANVVRIYDGVSENKENKQIATSTREENCEPEDCSITKSNKTFHFGYVGYLFPKKHQLEVIKACKMLSDSGCNNFEMHFYGDGKNSYKKELHKFIKRYGLSNVFVHGYVPDVSERLKQLDAGIIASEYEGFGLVTVEYMLGRLPVIGYRHSGTAEIVKDTETGILYDNEEELVLAMKKLMSEPELGKKLGAMGFKRATTEFTEEKNAEAILNLYKIILRGNNDYC